jgi:hypothetical protein
MGKKGSRGEKLVSIYRRERYIMVERMEVETVTATPYKQYWRMVVEGWLARMHTQSVGDPY